MTTVIKGDTRSLDYSSYNPEGGPRQTHNFMPEYPWAPES